MKRRTFSKEVKIEAMRRVQEHGVAVVQASRDLEVAESVLRRWIREADAAPASACPGKGQQRAELAAIAALKKEVIQLKAGRAILN